jgi:integrating conjugative element protein (TIGR03752 family)
MRSNALLKWLLVPLALVVVLAGIKLIPSSRRTAAPSHSSSSSLLGNDASLTPLEMKTLGVEGDTPHDTVATLVGQVKQLRGELKAAMTDTAQQKAENERLRAREVAIDQRVRDALNTERDHTREDREQVSAQQQETQSLLQGLQHRIDSLGNHPEGAELPIGLGLEDADGLGADEQGERWVEPQDGHPTRPKASQSNGPGTTGIQPTSSLSFPSDHADPASRTDSGHTDTGPEELAAPPDRAVLKRPTRPVYTVPTNSTLMGSIAMTALIGRVPVDGSVHDPYPFKVLIGSDNLVANGIEIPEVAAAVMSGAASGDWNFSCVRGRIRSVTFVFQDGTVRTVPSESTEHAPVASDVLKSADSGIGWISDPYGVPCVSGQRHSNAAQYLTAQMLITAAGAGAASLIPANAQNFSYIGTDNGNVVGTVGLTGNEAMGRVLAGGVQEMSQWVERLYGQAFAAVYVQPGAKVAVHIDQPIEIDYEPSGRRVRYNKGVPHAPGLD